METKMHKEEFHFTYSANEQEEVKAIRKKYLPQEEDKMQRLRNLDARTTNKGTMLSVILGVLGTLVLGGGMSMIMVLPGSFFIPGILIGIAGMAVLGSAYPVYRGIVKKEREKVAPEVLKLTEELMK